VFRVRRKKKKRYCIRLSRMASGVLFHRVDKFFKICILFLLVSFAQSNKGGFVMNKKSISELGIEALVKAGVFKISVKPQMRLEAAIQLFKDREITLGRGAEMAGITRYEFKDILEDRGIHVIVEPDSPKEMDRRAEKAIGKK
jgi:hypothetical protein